ncbi:hypothetical protein M2323_003211 [Rhodoblastus acidophilus]|uniref:hypothetical protein n=1 Tax=Rhodoblastus acidophilus TaxID=1074 RepID=UPI0022249E70|nr:hypothetical protein [Rhodoblastus acidophilus]MCW2285314.1 hypothetical protein [Rhodoblastus acidophilus]MCW2334270.1 hypothetical protein [Rhodoblastus acidophilus]
MFAVKNHFSELIEIDLLFAQAELATGATDRSALTRAIRHIEQALKSVRAQKAEDYGKRDGLKTHSAARG